MHNRAKEIVIDYGTDPVTFTIDGVQFPFTYCTHWRQTASMGRKEMTWLTIDLMTDNLIIKNEWENK